MRAAPVRKTPEALRRGSLSTAIAKNTSAATPANAGQRARHVPRGEARMSSPRPNATSMAQPTISVAFTPTSGINRWTATATPRIDPSVFTA